MASISQIASLATTQDTSNFWDAFSEDVLTAFIVERLSPLLDRCDADSKTNNPQTLASMNYYHHEHPSKVEVEQARESFKTFVGSYKRAATATRAGSSVISSELKADPGADSLLGPGGDKETAKTNDDAPPPTGAGGMVARENVPGLIAADELSSIASKDLDGASSMTRREPAKELLQEHENVILWLPADSGREGHPPIDVAREAAARLKSVQSRLQLGPGAPEWLKGLVEADLGGTSKALAGKIEAQKAATSDDDLLVRTEELQVATNEAWEKERSHQNELDR